MILNTFCHDKRSEEVTNDDVNVYSWDYRTCNENVKQSLNTCAYTETTRMEQTAGYLKDLGEHDEPAEKDDAELVEEGEAGQRRKSIKEFNAEFGKEEIEAENTVDLLKYEKRDVKGDAMNFILLTFLYFVQGAVAGLMMAVPLILQKRDAPYEQQAIFHLSTYAMSFKILWIPILDSFFLKGEGRRKLVLVTMQYLIGGFLLIVSMNIHYCLGTDDDKIKPHIVALTVVFFLCSLFSSIQDAALDGWSLTIFQKKSKIYSASCRGLGVSLGLILIFPGFINLESTYFANQFRSVPGDTGFVDFQGFTFFLAVVFIITTSLILKFKREKRDKDIEIDLSKADKDRNQDIRETYAHLQKILQLGPIQMMTFFLLTWHFAFGPINNAAPLKLLDYGVPRGKLSMILVCGIPLQLCLPLVLDRYVKRPQPVRIFYIAYILRLLNCFVLAVLIFLLSINRKSDIKDGYWYYAPLIIIFSLNHITVFAMIMAMVALFTRISHHQFGSAFMTLFISLNNLGGSWPSTASLWFMDSLQFKITCPCPAFLCGETKELPVNVDGYHVETAVCTLIGILWIRWAKKKIHQLEITDAALVHNLD